MVLALRWRDANRCKSTHIQIWIIQTFRNVSSLTYLDARLLAYNDQLPWLASPRVLESLSSTSDTNTDTNNMSCACSLLERSTRTSVLEVTTTEVGFVLEVGGIVR